MTNQITLPRETVEQALACIKTTAQYKAGVPAFEQVECAFVTALAITEGRAALANAEPAGCLWSKDPDFEMGDTYDSSCGEKWSFIDGGPTENRVKFCQGCGKPVKLI